MTATAMMNNMDNYSSLKLRCRTLKRRGNAFYACEVKLKIVQPLLSTFTLLVEAGCV